MSDPVEANCLETSRNLSEQLVHLGYDRAFEPSAAATGRLPDVVTVARYGPFRVFAIHCTGDTDHEAKRLARHLQTRGERSLVIVVKPNTQDVTLAAWRVGKPPITRVVPLGDLQRLDQLAPREGDSGLSLHFRVVSALERAPVTAGFFRAFRRTIDEMARYPSVGAPPDVARALALTQLSRVLFLYFVQSKGWLNGETDYLRRRLDHYLSQKRSFQEGLLHPLVFTALRSPGPHQAQHGTIPTLNGGMFERTGLERHFGVPVWPNHVWRRAFDRVFERFEFSIRETDASDTVQPDMLGRVFEELMDPAERRRRGTFFTPHRLVIRVVDAALAPLLARRAQVPDVIVQRALTGEAVPLQHHRTLLEAVRHLTILDPAVGSGAFLLGAMERVVTLHQALLDPHTVPPHRLRRLILQNNLFGVDRDIIAVRLAELRLWLAVVADDPSTEPRAVTPLPNLDGVIRQGDSLIDPLTHGVTYLRGGADGRRSVEKHVTSVAEARRSLFEARGPAKRRHQVALRSAERRLAQNLVKTRVVDVETRIRQELDEARRQDLFGQRNGLTVPTRQRIRALRAERSRLRRLWRQVTATDELGFFSFELHWPDILRDGGFDLVVGNPPWVRGERIDRALRTTLSARYRSFRTVGSGFKHVPDLAQAFVERGLELVAPGGILAFLVPSKLATAGYAAPLRALLAEEAILEEVWRVESPREGDFRAAVYPLLLVASKPHVGRRQRSERRPHEWAGSARSDREIRRRLLASPLKLGDRWPPTIGVKTGANGIFLGTMRGEHFHSLDGESVAGASKHIRPVIRGRDVRPFRFDHPHSIIWTHDADRRPLPLSGNLAAYFRRHGRRLQERRDYRGGPVWELYRTAAVVPRPRVVWPDLATRLTAAVILPSSRVVPLNTCYVAITDTLDDAFALSVFLNSSLAAWLARASADEARGGYRRHNARVVGQLPLPADQSTAWPALAEIGRHAHESGHIPLHEIDEIVSTAFGIEPDELRMVT